MRLYSPWITPSAVVTDTTAVQSGAFFMYQFSHLRPSINLLILQSLSWTPNFHHVGMTHNRIPYQNPCEPLFPFTGPIYNPFDPSVVIIVTSSIYYRILAGLYFLNLINPLGETSVGLGCRIPIYTLFYTLLNWLHWIYGMNVQIVMSQSIKLSLLWTAFLSSSISTCMCCACLALFPADRFFKDLFIFFFFWAIEFKDNNIPCWFKQNINCWSNRLKPNLCQQIYSYHL